MGMGEETKVAYQYKVPEASERKPDPNQLWDGDYLGHSRIVPTVANMIAGQKGPLTIGLNARWGSGKTFFLKRLAEYYMTPDGYAVYFNAWADDFIGDPLVSLVCQLQEPFDGKVGDTLLKSAKQALFPTLKHVGFSLAKSLLKNKIGIDLGDLTPEELETRVEGISKDYSQCVATREELKSVLTKLGGEVKAKTHKPLLVIVDELDRCRPTYAIELLERIKHLFCIENVVFILGIDKEQLGKSIAAVYGNINVEWYLHRFVDIEMGLPDAPKDIFIERLIRRLKLEDCLQDGGADVSVGSFVKAFSAIANSQKLTPRMIEQAIRKFSLVAFAKGHLIEAAIKYIDFSGGFWYTTGHEKRNQNGWSCLARNAPRETEAGNQLLQERHEAERDFRSDGAVLEGRQECHRSLRAARRQRTQARSEGASVRKGTQAYGGTGEAGSEGYLRQAPRAAQDGFRPLDTRGRARLHPRAFRDRHARPYRRRISQALGLYAAEADQGRVRAEAGGS